jgi:type II secretory pathway pseudopilin PulG
MDTLGQVLFGAGLAAAAGVLAFAATSAVRVFLKQRAVRRYEEEIALLEEAKEALAEARACVAYADALTSGDALSDVQDCV